MTFGQSISTCFSNFANFQGRARRSKFWWLFLFSSVILFVIQVLLAFAPDGFPDSTAFAVTASSIIGIVLLIPFYAVDARRLHDTGKSGWLQLLVLIPCAG
ncbi:MAG TPA: DUF805 domain-containing protein, partial [Actinobacteria bacterium]|nr:DUF805 domain-containing protein [Actinomycetota bacterium]